MDTRVTKEGQQLGQEKRIEAGKIIRLDEEQIKEHLSGMVLQTVEETLNALLDADNYR